MCATRQQLTIVAAEAHPRQSKAMHLQQAKKSHAKAQSSQRRRKVVESISCLAYLLCELCATSVKCSSH
jgi:hypothetical protein